MNRYLVVLFVMIFSGNAIAATANVVDSLNLFFKDLKTLTADFEQVVENSQLNSTEKANGKLWIQRPGKFRWDYDAPYEQEIVSDGAKLWIFDKDLEQVTVKAVSASMGNTPAVLLSGAKPLAETFKIVPLDFGTRLDWVELKPKEDDASFTAIRLGFEATTLKIMLLEDNLGQTTRLVFSHLQRNPTIDANKFIFTPPAGVDVFETSD